MHDSILFALVGFAAHATAACSRALLQDAATAYIKAQTSGQPSLLPLASNITYLENDTPLDITKGLLSQAVKVDFNRSLYDTTECIAFTEISAATNSHPYVIDTRLIFTDDKITTVQTVVADTGDWLFDAKSQLSYTQKENWDVIADTKRDTRAVIKAAGDAYLDSWGDGKVKVPYGSPCARLEGGMYTTSCKMPEFPQPFKITVRRYVVDEEAGGVAIFNDFPFIDKTKPNGTSSVNFIRVEGGMIRYIHEVTICSTKNCGR